jgi:hypothetical protein
LRIDQEAEEQGNAGFTEVDLDLFTELVARSMPFIKVVGRGNQKITVPAYPSQRLVKQLMASPICPLPVARGMIRTPSFDARGALIQVPGYHAASGIFYAPPPNFVLPPIPAKPTRDDVINAIAIWGEVIGDFPFIDDGNAGIAHMYALPISVLARELIKGPVPMFLISKPVTGTGGTLLLQSIGWAVLGEPLPESAWSADQEELRKFLTSLLISGRPLINLDNITYLYSKDLLMVLSGSVREDRKMGGNDLLSIPNRAVFAGSGNNVGFDEEHAGRLVVTRLDAGVENPRLRDMTFVHPDLIEWTKAQRPELVAALLTIIQAWLAADRPAYTGKRLAGFEAWSTVVGGILEYAGVKGFLANRDEVMQVAQRSQDEDHDFVAAWLEFTEYDTPVLTGLVKTKELLKELERYVPAPKGGAKPNVVSLGRYLERNVDKVRTLDSGAVVAIRRTLDTHTKQPRWQLDVLRPADDPHRPREYEVERESGTGGPKM